ncbi:MAG TPA: Glu/Leu/Phe/Val dehydrogenase dimerization domain-containing protein [Solirubrobacterales bacterium]|nr:Glu/Leu/Phe/Val dehydrogenase dimerization domain-containing protein [Solirubrobacterales bacterium]
MATPVATDTRTKREHEELVVQHGARSGATMAVAIHSTFLGPALGGVRLWHYQQDEDGVSDALRLARGMTFKAAAAGLRLGGGKGVICAHSQEPPTGEERRAIFLDFGDLVDSLEGRYVTAEDVGTCPGDMIVIAERTRHVTGRPPERGGTGDPSPFTAIGVQAAMRASAKAAFGTPDLAGRHVVVAGLGHVGESLARGLAEAGAKLGLSDINPAKRAIADELDGNWLDPGHALETECDVISPCAVGGAIHDGNVDHLRCRVICGAANNQLADEGLATNLHARGILYAPDFIANAGGLINVYREVHSYSAERATELALGIESTMAGLIARAEAESCTPLAAAYTLAEERLAAG